jgi:hypothetical protein
MCLGLFNYNDRLKWLCFRKQHITYNFSLSVELKDESGDGNEENWDELVARNWKPVTQAAFLEDQPTTPSPEGSPSPPPPPPLSAPLHTCPARSSASKHQQQTTMSTLQHEHFQAVPQAPSYHTPNQKMPRMSPSYTPDRYLEQRPSRLHTSLPLPDAAAAGADQPQMPVSRCQERRMRKDHDIEKHQTRDKSDPHYQNLP